MRLRNWAAALLAAASIVSAGCGEAKRTDPLKEPRPGPDRTLPNPHRNGAEPFGQTGADEPGTGGSGSSAGNGDSIVGVGKPEFGSTGIVDSSPPAAPVTPPDSSHTNTPHSMTY